MYVEVHIALKYKLSDFRRTDEQSKDSIELVVATRYMYHSWVSFKKNPTGFNFHPARDECRVDMRAFLEEVMRMTGI